MRNYYHQIYEYLEKLVYLVMMEEKQGKLVKGESLQLMDLLLMVWINNRSQVSIQQLAEETGLKRNDLASAVKRLAEREMLLKKSAKKDRRVQELALTPFGKETLAQFREEKQSHLFELLNEFTFNEEKAILKFLVKVDMRYRDAGVEKLESGSGYQSRGLV